jgi:hypothetical protein
MVQASLTNDAGTRARSCRELLFPRQHRQCLDHNMPKSRSESSEDFEFIETPAAPTPVPPVEDCGVRTTSVSFFTACHCPDQALTTTVPGHQECSPTSRCLWQRYFQQLLALCLPRHRAMVPCSLGSWRLLDNLALLPLHLHPDLDVLLDDCLEHITSQE